MKIEDFKGKRVTIMGIGLHGGGLGAINFFYQAGAKILATDLRTRRELRESLDELRRNLEQVVAMLLEDGEPALGAEFVGTQTIQVA